jgi:hypothetical protein
MERRSLLDDEIHEHANVFDDEFAEEFDGVVDGYRPSDRERDAETGEVDGHPIRTVSAHYASTPVSPGISARPSRNSTQKSRSGPGGGTAENPFASPEDGDEGTPSLSFEPEFAGHRSMSSASSNNFARTGSQRFVSGPSHPYGMYPQGTMGRSPSLATQSTVRPAHWRSTSLRNGPQHPYTLYPQCVTEDVDDDEDDIRQNPVPVGFPGLGQSYQRRLGPDGEEQDIIGEDGHTEQLPPYSRYPEDGPEKVPLLVPEAPQALHSRAPVAGTDPTMELMHTTLLPQVSREPQSMTDASSMRSSGRPMSIANVELMHSREQSAANKSWNEKTWKEKRNTKFCGIPLWWIILAVCVVTFIVAVISGVLGGFFANARKHHHPYVDPLSSRMPSANISQGLCSGQIIIL